MTPSTSHARSPVRLLVPAVVAFAALPSSRSAVQDVFLRTPVPAMPHEPAPARTLPIGSAAERTVDPGPEVRSVRATGAAGAFVPTARPGDARGTAQAARDDRARLPEDTTWRLEWDDSTDLELDPGAHACRLRLDEIDGAINGSFIGPVAGTERRAVFAGELVQGARPLLLLEQREPGYVCAYQLMRMGAGRWLGTWSDSRGGRGTAELADEQSLPRPPHALVQPEVPLEMLLDR